MGAEEAFRLLERLVSQIPSDDLRGLTAQQLLDGLEAACWRRFSPSSPVSKLTYNQHQPASPRLLSVPYSQLYSGVMESIRVKQDAIQSLEAKIRETMAHTNELPRRIRAHEQEIATTIASFVALSATSLDCAVQRNRRDFGSHLLKTRVDTDMLADKVRERVATLRRRRELRTWACEQLRAQINDHMTRASELKKEITVVLGEVKKEEAAHKIKTRRMEEAMVGMNMSPTGRKNSMTGVVATKMLVSGGLAAVATAASLPGAAPSLALSERLVLAQEKRQELQEAIALKKEHVRRRTEEIFDVRNEVQQLEAQRADVVAQTEAFELEMVHIQRACTPRPDWEELQRAVTVTTAIDRLGKNARRSLHSRERRGQRSEIGDEDDEMMGRRLRAVLTSKWSTVEKVAALAEQLCLIRERYHGGEELSTERARLTQLQKEIQTTLEQLATIRSLPSRGAAATTPASETK